MIDDGVSLQINGFTLDGEIPLLERFDDGLKRCFFVIKGDDETIGLLGHILLDTAHGRKDSPYPFVGASRQATGNRQLHDFLRRARNMDKRQHHQKRHGHTHDFFFHLSSHHP
jgi:hypothetical protein